MAVRPDHCALSVQTHEAVFKFCLRRRRSYLPPIAMIALAPLILPATEWPRWPVQQSPGVAGDPQQDPTTLPRPISPTAPGQPRRSVGSRALVPTPEGSWRLVGRWRLRGAFDVAATAREISTPGYDAGAWYEATMPGTVLTTLVDQGVYPEPTFGLNNLAIPEALNRQDYWYRTEFDIPNEPRGRNATLVFHGINYAAEVWLNGVRLGAIRGAFQRGTFELGDLVRPGEHAALAVRVSPVPHPGIPHEQSLAAGAGPNGGAMCFDGPTFFCTEGWDWLPGIRDRCTGIWQDVELRLHGPVTLGDVQVISDLPLPDRSVADVSILATVSNRSEAPQTFVLAGEFEGARFTQDVTLATHESREVRLDSRQHRDLHVTNPRLWWPNGYGRPELYHLTLTAIDAQQRESDRKSLRFGIRELSYELTAVDPQGELQRCEFTPAAADPERLIDVRHDALRQSPVGWVPSLTPEGARSPALQPVPDTRTAPFLVIKVNGTRIVAKGGNWGLDEALKRCSRERLEPFIRLERDAHLTMIRNWCGQSTEEAFFELCDEYGIMVWNDFWASTQNWNQQPGDLQLWLDNAADVIRRFRHHPSIVVWCGRNEGVPPPALNEGLDQLIRELDGTRYYQPGSIDINLLNSGPWVHREPVRFFAEYGHGFTTEIGLPCVPTADAIRAMMRPADQWPISDTWAYHDWHQKDHGEVQVFVEALEQQFGPATDLDDFCRKAQMLNYAGHRAVFEGLNARLWQPASGRLLWMSHPAWPSMEWQLYSSDGDPNGAFFGAQKACEPLHVQLNLDDRLVVVTNTTGAAADSLTVEAALYDLHCRPLGGQRTALDSAANTTRTAFRLDETPARALPLYFVRLTLTDANHHRRSDNLYWIARTAADHRALNQLPHVVLTGVAYVEVTATGTRVAVTLRNPGETLALLLKPTLRNRVGQRILPAFVSEGGFSLFPGEERSMTIATAHAIDPTDLQVTIEGWNASARIVADVAATVP